MWYLGCLFILVVVLAACSVTGAALCRILPFRIRAHATAGLAPLVGLAVFVLLATAVGWMGIGFRTWISFPLSAAVVLTALWFSEDLGKTLRNAAQASAFAVVASAGWFFSIIRYQAFNPYDDAFTYLVQAQWLQRHPFREIVRPSGQYPAWTQVATYQALHLRMGASFFFGWVQAAFGVDWSYLVYPVIMVLPLVVGALAVAGMALFTVRKGRVVCFLGAAAGATTFNGFSFGTLLGFMPQSYGIAFAFGGLGFLGMYIYCLKRDGFVPTRALIPGAMVLSALLFCYPEITPLILIAALIYLLIELLLNAGHVRGVVSLVGRLALAIVLITNAEIVRAFKSVVVQAKAVVGGPVVWTPLQFLGHAAGFLSGAWDGSLWAFYSAYLTEAVVLLFLMGSSAVLFRYRRRIRFAVLGPAMSVLAVSICAWLYFRYLSPSPWNVGIGQSWSQFKISNWASLFLLFVLTCAAALASRGNRLRMTIVLGGLLLWEGGGLAANYVMADYRTRAFRQETGFDYAPFSSYLQMRAVAGLAAQEPIFLDLGGQHHKNREMLTYFLTDRPVVSDWSDDGYLFPMLPEAERTYRIQPSMWIITSTNAGRLRAGEQRVGTLGLLRAASLRTQLIQVVGGYAQENAGASSWKWTPHRLEYRYQVLGADPLRIRARFTYLPASSGRHLRMEVSESTPRTIETIAMQPTWTTVTAPSFEVHSSEFSLTFESDEPPIRLGPADSRTAGFLIKDLSLEAVE
jgi:hypothetical protein